MYLKGLSNAKIRLRSQTVVWVISAIASDNREVLSTREQFLCAILNLYISHLSAPAIAEDIPLANDCITFSLKLIS